MTTPMREWSPVGLALSCVLAAIALCLRSENQLLHLYDLAGVSQVFIYSFLLGVVALCVGVYVSAHDEEQRRWSIAAGLIAGALGVAFALFCQVISPVVSAAGSGVFLGFSLACLLRQWGRYYRLLTFFGALLNTTLAFLVASCLWFAIVHAGTPFLFCLGLLVLIIGGSLPLLARQIVQADEVRAGLRTETAVQPLVTLRQVMRQGWAAVLGLMFNFFTIGLTFFPEEAGLGSVGLSPKPVAYALLALTVWLVLSRAYRGHGGGIVEVFYRALLPIAAAIMLASPFVESVVFPLGSFPFSVVSYLGIALCNVLGLVVLFWSAKSSEVGFSKIFAAFCASCAVSVAAGMLVFQLLGKSAQVVSLCLLAAYLVAMVLGEIKSSAVRQRALRQTEPEFFGGLCDNLSERYGLSARESEILPFLARGRGAKHIADKLYISPETVRTHCKRIYDKMDVHTKEELLDLVEKSE